LGLVLGLGLGLVLRLVLALGLVLGLRRRVRRSRIRVAAARAAASTAAGAPGSAPAGSAGMTSAGASAAAARLTLTGCALAPLGGRRCGHHGQIRGFDGGTRYLMADVALDVGQRDGVFLATEADGVALGAGACGTAYAMHVVLRIVR
jgi:hypothetical protein